jgi:hypothetical protein
VDRRRRHKGYEGRAAGVSTQEWIEAVLGWQARLASNSMVENALQLIMDPDITPMSRWDSRP